MCHFCFSLGFSERRLMGGCWSAPQGTQEKSELQKVCEEMLLACELRDKAKKDKESGNE